MALPAVEILETQEMLEQAATVVLAEIKVELAVEAMAGLAATLAGHMETPAAMLTAKAAVLADLLVVVMVVMEKVVDTVGHLQEEPVTYRSSAAAQAVAAAVAAEAAVAVLEVQLEMQELQILVIQAVLQHQVQPPVS